MAPIKGYFEFEAQPPIIIPQTPKDETAKIYKIPTLISATTQFSANGITAQDDKATKQVKDLEVKNDMNGRFEIIVLHIFIIFYSLKENSEVNKIFKQNFLETFIDELESTYRELGISDNTFGKKMKTAAKSLYGRLNIYNNTFKNNSKFEEALLRNIWPLDTELTNKVHKLSEYAYKKVDKYSDKSFIEIIKISEGGF